MPVCFNICNLNNFWLHTSSFPLCPILHRNHLKPGKVLCLGINVAEICFACMLMNFIRQLNRGHWTSHSRTKLLTSHERSYYPLTYCPCILQDFDTVCVYIHNRIRMRSIFWLKQDSENVAGNGNIPVEHIPINILNLTWSRLQLGSNVLYRNLLRKHE